MSQLQIRVRNLGKAYDKTRVNRANASLYEWARLFGWGASGISEENSFWAIKDISFDIRPGERVGIIGHNGAGKSTLLKVLSRIVSPTCGEAMIRGRVSSLLELGTGFSEELSGRDNIYLSASMYGLTQDEINQKYDEIVAFSGVGKFINKPIKYYSSGMRMRLAFSVSVNVEPDVLILDEVLAVGDIAFQKKCLNKISGLTSQSRTLLFVSHSLGDIARFCDRVIWLDEGRVKFDGDSAEGLRRYQNQMLGESEAASGDLINFRGERTGTGQARFDRIRVLDENLQPLSTICTGQNIVLEFQYSLRERIDEAVFEVSVAAAFENERRQRLFATPSEIIHENLGELGERGRFLCKINRFPLVPGVYSIAASFHINRQLVDKVVDGLTLNIFEGDFFGTGHLPLPAMGQVCVPFEWQHETNNAPVKSHTL